MRLRIIVLMIVQVFGLFLPFTFASVSNASQRISSRTAQKFTEAELTERFKEVLLDELSTQKRLKYQGEPVEERVTIKSVYATVPAAWELSDLMRKAAAEIIQKEAFDKVPEAEKNIRYFADGLMYVTFLNRGEGDRVQAGEIELKITSSDIKTVLQRRSGNPSLGALCPLFPICR